MAQKSLRKLIGATIGIFIALLTNVASAVTNYTDMWFNPSESGWGVNFSQDYNGPIFATFFVYAASGAPTWVGGLLALDPVGGMYSGTLYETSSGAPLTSQSFNPAAVQVSNVGTVSFTPTDAANGTLAYTYRGTAVVKQITREPLYTADTVSNATFLTFTPGGTAYRAIFESRNNGQCSATYPPHQTIGATWRIFPTAVTSSSISLRPEKIAVASSVRYGGSAAARSASTEGSRFTFSLKASLTVSSSYKPIRPRKPVMRQSTQPTGL